MGLCVFGNKRPVRQNEHTVHSLLFIEDDDAIRLALRLALEDEGYEVREAANGAEGLAEFAQHPRAQIPPLTVPQFGGF